MARFPLFYRARSFRAVLSHGDSLFIPAGWWHWVFSTEHCLAISHVVYAHESADVIRKQAAPVFNRPVAYSPTQTIDFRKHRVESTPFVCHDPHLSRVTDDFLIRTVHDVNLLVSTTSTCNPVHKQNNPTTQILNATYHDFIGLSESGYHAYIGMTPIRQSDFAPYLNDAWKVHVDQTKCPNRVYLWHSHRQTDTGLHYDITDNLLTVHRGRKTVHLFPPSETAFLYNAPVTNCRNYGYVRRCVCAD